MVFPVNKYESSDRAKQYIWTFMDENLSSEVFSMLDVEVPGEDLDMLMLVPEKGAIVAAVRDYHDKEIMEVIGHDMIRLDGRPVDYSAYMQAIKGREAFIRAIADKYSLDQRLVTVAVCYPFVSSAAYEDKGLSEISPRALTFVKEDMAGSGTFLKKVNDIFDFAFSAQNISEEDVAFPVAEMIEIGSLFEDGFRDAVGDALRDPVVLEVDLRVSSQKELYYGICSFLMKNGILRGMIYSRSKALLDGLGSYMSSVRIPWCYGHAGESTVGYRLIDGRTPEHVTGKEVVIDLNNNKIISVVQGNTRRYNIEISDSDPVYEGLDTFDIQAPLHLKNEQIRKMFLKSFLVAEKEIDIISPWMNFGVVNEKFVELMEKALERGVTIKILYGLKPDSSEYNLSRSNRSDQVAAYLKEHFRRFEERLLIQRDNIHYKLVLCDEKFKLEGGYNYLSFMGDYENSDTRREGSPFGTDIDEIRFLRKEYFGDNE